MSRQDDVDTETTPINPVAPAVTGLSRRGSARRRGSQRPSNLREQTGRYKKSVVAGDSFGFHGNAIKSKKNINHQSMTFVADESDVWRAHWSIEHYMLRGRFWNRKKFEHAQTYFWIVMTGIVQAVIAFGANFTSKVFIEWKFNMAGRYLAEGSILSAFLRFYLVQLAFAAVAGICVYIEPISGGSGIPEVKCYLNGIDLPKVLDIRTLFCKVIGVTCSVSAGLPVGKEGPMIHSGAVVAKTVASGDIKNDRELRDLVTCGAAAGVCTAFSAPIGGILFALEEGASYWSPSLTWRTFTCSMIALTTLMILNSVFAQNLGRVGFDKLFSFGNFVFEDGGSSYAIYELVIFVLIGATGGLIGAIFNNINESITHWRMARINHSKRLRFLEVMAVSTLMSFVMFFVSLAWPICRSKEEIFADGTSQQNDLLWEDLIQFTCEDGEYNEMASLLFSEPSDAIRLLFHLQKPSFSSPCLLGFFLIYISIAVLTYGTAVPSGLFVPSLLSGAAFGRFFGNELHKIYPKLALSNTYSLMGAAAVLGGMARMTISLTVILLECTGNEQFVLPLMLVLMAARVVGMVFNDDLYHIHIHLKKGVEFLEAELESITHNHNIVAGQIMGSNVIFVRPVEKAGVVYDILMSAAHSNFPVVDTDDSNVLYGTIGRNALCVLLQQRAFGEPFDDANSTISSSFLQVNERRYFPLVQWDVLFKAYPRYPAVTDLRITEADREQLMDLRPYVNSAAITVQETSSVQRTYSLFRNLGLRFLPVVNKYNQVVGTITRSDLTADSLAETMLQKGKKHGAEIF